MSDDRDASADRQRFAEAKRLANVLAHVRLRFWEADDSVSGHIEKLFLTGITGVFFVTLAWISYHGAALVDTLYGSVSGLIVSIVAYLASYFSLLSGERQPPEVLHGKFLQTMLVVIITTFFIFAMSNVVSDRWIVEFLIRNVGRWQVFSNWQSHWVVAAVYALLATTLIGFIGERVRGRPVTAAISKRTIYWGILYVVLSASVLHLSVLERAFEIF